MKSLYTLLTLVLPNNRASMVEISPSGLALPRPVGGVFITDIGAVGVMPLPKSLAIISNFVDKTFPKIFLLMCGNMLQANLAL